MSNQATAASSIDLTPLLNPRSIAIVGASEKSFYSLMLQKNLEQFGYEGNVYPVNPRYETINGLKSYPSITDLPEAPDNVSIMVRRELVLDTVKEAIAKGAKSAYIVTAGFGESDEPEWKQVEEEMARLSVEHNFPILGPNCLGAIAVHNKFGGFSAPLRGGIIPGNIALIMQSGGILQGLCLPFKQRGVGLSFAISSGNNLCLDIADYVDYILDDDNTQVICVYLEGIRKPEKFKQVLEKALKLRKPIIALKIGKSEKAAQATLAHTGSLAGSDTTINAVFEKYGVIRVADFDELLETAVVFSYRKIIENIHPSAGISLITGSGGAVGLVNDLVEDNGVDLAEFSAETKSQLKQILPPSANISNPVDVTGQILNDMDMYSKTLKVMNADPGVGVIVELMPLGLPSDDIPFHKKLMLEQVVDKAGEIDKPIILCSMNAHSLDDWQREFLGTHKEFAFTQGVGKTLKGLQHLLDYSKFIAKREKEQAAVAVLASSKREQAVAFLNSIGRKVLTEAESKQLLSIYGIPVSQEKTVSSEQAAVDTAEKIGYPVVLKIDSPDILHKTEAGGVKVGLNNAGEVAQAFNEIINNAKKYKPDAQINGVLVQEMVFGGTEVIVGVNRDEQFGPTVMFGVGGIFVEVFKDSVFKLAPLTREEADKMIRSIKGYKILSGARGKKPRDIEAIAEALMNVSQMAVDLQDYISEVDINPLLAMEQGVKAVDGLIVLR